MAIVIADVNIAVSAYAAVLIAMAARQTLPERVSVVEVVNEA